MSSYSVHVSNIAPQTTETHLSDFFTFCGKIQSIDYKQDEKSAVVHFEKSSAVKTALMLNGGSLDGSTLSVTSDAAHHEEDDVPPAEGVPYHQSDKPRAAIAAEYLAKGYSLSDHILQRAIDIDQKQGISKRFLNYFNSIDTTIGAKTLGPEQTVSGKVQSTLQAATQHAKDLDQQKGISKSAGDYYSKALAHPLGKKVFDFYTTTSKQIFDIHDEARRIVDAQKPVSPSVASPTLPTAPAVIPASGAVATPEVAGYAVVEEKKEAPTVV